MPIIAAGVVVLAIIIGVSASTGSVSSSTLPVIAAEAGRSVSSEHRALQLRVLDAVVPAPVQEITGITIVADPIPKPAPVPRTPQFVVPAFEPLPPAPEPTHPDPAAEACLGKFVGTRCTLIVEGVEKEGTCMTPAWRPVTCVQH